MQKLNSDLEAPIKVSLKEIFFIFLKLGSFGFGGPVSLISMMEIEFVRNRKIIGENEFLDMIGTTNLIPGPNAMEMAIHLGYILRGTIGLAVAGLSFVLPGVMVSILLAWLLVSSAQLSFIVPVLFGIKSVVIGIIIGTVFRMGKKAIKGMDLLILGLIIVIVSIWIKNPIFLLFGGGFIGMLWLGIKERWNKNTNMQNSGLIMSKKENMDERQLEKIKLSHKEKQRLKKSAIIAFSVWILFGLMLKVLSLLFPSQTYFQLGWFFFSVGSIMYGSGLILIAFIEKGLVIDRGWINSEELLNTIAIGQISPGPVSSTSAAIGFLVNGLTGAIVATFCMFLPSFLVVIVIDPIMHKLRDSQLASRFLDAVNVSAISIMLVISIRLFLGLNTSQSWGRIFLSISLIVVSLIFSLRLKKPNSFILIFLGALVGWIANYFTF
ncbi:MAG: chromate efflux transporter [Promethearchaeota archaeon]